MKVSVPHRYQLLRELGRGGMGVVYLVRDRHLQREVALKLLHRRPAPAEEVDQLRREFMLLSRLEHPGIARVHDFGFLGKRPYFTAEFIPGEPLGAKGALADVDEVVSLARDVASAVAFLHANDLLHLDIKPSNIIRRAGPDRSCAVLIDFGLCRHVLGSPARRSLQGSLPYMAPEYFRGGALGGWTDVYALGVTLYRLATGRFPRRGAAADGALGAEEGWLPAPLPPSRLRPPLPEDLDHLILRCLALEPGGRFASGGELLAALERVPGRPAPAVLAPARLASTVGRTAELAEADCFLDGLRGTAPAPAALLVVARPGMGLSHFLEELKARAQTRGFHAYLERGYPGRPGAPGSLLHGLGAHLGGSDGKGRARWAAFLARLRRSRQPPASESSEGERRLRRASEASLALAALSQPLLLAVDDLQFADEISLALLIDLVRGLQAKAPGERPPLGIAVGFREEGPSVPLLRELACCLLEAGAGIAITLSPLGLEDTLGLYRSRCGEAPAPPADRGPAALQLYQATGGCPRSIVELALGGGAIPPAGAAGPAPHASGRIDRLAGGARRLLLTLSLLRRPAAVPELSALSGVRRSETNRRLRELQAAGLAAEVEASPVEGGWLAAPPGERLARGAGDEERRRVHLRIARSLVAAGGGADDPRTVEVVRHFGLAGRPSEVVRHGLRAAGYLSSTCQNRAALDLYQRVLEALPRRSRGRRLEVVLEMAELYSRAGNLDQGIRLLRDLLARRSRLPRPARLRTLLLLATLYSRRGDFQRAEAHFREGLGAARGKRSVLSRAEVLRFLNEHAAVKTFQGEYGEARRLCREGLRLARRSRSFASREVELNLHATLANVALRAYDYQAARRGFERALEIAEAIGSLANQAVILNNLGIVYGQCDRSTEAIRAFREAERSCLRLDEGPSLASIYGNLAILHAKRGEFEEMERALGQGERPGLGALGRREQCFLRHARGLGLTYEGRFGEARAALEAAIQRGEAIGDLHVAAFDRVYRAEGLLFTGAYAEAARELEAMAEARWPGRVRRMALARLAFLNALAARVDAPGACAARHAELAGERPVPFLDAWDAVYLGWAFSVALDPDRALPQLEAAEVFFRKHALLPGLSAAVWTRAECLFLDGRPERAREALASLPQAGGGFTRALAPLLQARLCLEETDDAAARARAADLLAEAGAALVGNPLPEWSARLLLLRARLEEDPAPALAEVERRRGELALGLPEEARPGYLQSRHFRAWAVAGADEPRREAGPRRRASRSPAPPSPTTRTVGRERAPESSRAGLVARSPAMQAVVAVLDRLRGSDLPVLIRGETGAGKELVARIIHAESRRAGGPFHVVDCAAIPPALLEAELFGARAGAFTDLRGDRKGILVQAAGGTVLIDEIAGTSLEVQAKLLRVISEGRCRPLGAEGEEALDVRFLFATARDLEAEVREGRFRRDLVHRVQVVTVKLPPLRERPEDLSELAALLLAETGGEPPAIDPEAIERLRLLSWPGNVRELKNLLLRLKIESPRRLTAGAVDRLLADPKTATLFPRNLLAAESFPALKERLERDYLLYHLHRLRGDTTALSRFLKLSLRQLYRRCERLKIALRKERIRLRRQT